VNKKFARRWLLGGHVQGVGFRPFVYRLAFEYKLHGWVRNQRGQVEILAQGAPDALSDFAAGLLERAPAIASPRILATQDADLFTADGFSVAASDADAEARIAVPPDYAVCGECLAEMRDPSDRRFGYPFINCTQCGPRYTLIRSLPYDRGNTSMAGFDLCADCRAEYEDIADRRFHAEPVACPACGPSLSFHRQGEAPLEGTEPALAACVDALRAGELVAVKGVGGYHLVCDAASDAAVQSLRERKPRPHKPLAVMFPETGADGLDAVRECADVDETGAGVLLAPSRPIVLLEIRKHSRLSSHVAPGLAEVGVMLPYSPLHHRLLDLFGGPQVATSANLSGEPVLTGAEEVEARLAHVAQACLHHDRPIVRPADDPVVRIVAGRARPLRLGRGTAPLEIDLPFELERPVLAVGAHMKNTVALGWGDRAVVSPHIGDMGAPRSLKVFMQVVADLQALYAVEAQIVACDRHPDYATSRWAREQGLPVVEVWHHHAHASALVGDVAAEDSLVFTWDGVGLGEDGTLWGGEALVGRPGAWRRAATFRPFDLPGGDKAGREPWRSAAALCWQAGLDYAPPVADGGVVRQAWDKRLNCHRTTAAGRLFDAAAALTGLCGTASFEGQGPMLLEAAADTDAPAIELDMQRNEDGLFVSDWSDVLSMLRDDSLSVAQRAGAFHHSLARTIVDQANAVRAETGVSRIGLTGGVFQNRPLTETAMRGLEAGGFEVLDPGPVPVNDAGIAFGQVVEGAVESAVQG